MVTWFLFDPLQVSNMICPCLTADTPFQLVTGAGTKVDVSNTDGLLQEVWRQTTGGGGRFGPAMTTTEQPVLQEWVTKLRTLGSVPCIQHHLFIALASLCMAFSIACNVAGECPCLLTALSSVIAGWYSQCQAWCDPVPSRVER